MSLIEQLFKIDSLSLFVGIFIGIFSLLTIVYSVGFMKRVKGLIRYYLYIVLTLLASLGAVFSNNLILFMVFWGFLGLLLYLLISFGKNERTPATAKKAFIIIGGTDALMLLGLAFIWKISQTFQIDQMSISLNTHLAVLAYLCLAAGAFAKAGAMPFHTWVPDTAEDAPTPVTAFLPASLDKLLGIYFLVRISLDMFRMNTAMNTVLMAVGSFTIVAAVMMALIQHDLKRLLGYHAVSQVGYMVLGIGTGNPIGIAGGLFHMLNHAIYKSCLFFSCGSVEKKAGTTDLGKLGGLAKAMPITFVTFLIAS
ncbi:MAG: proton-conducting transporter membrane subunit, partial [Candidatus Omnitrophota bacterium]